MTAFTRPVLDGVNTVYTAGEIYNAINNQEGTVKLLLAYSDAGIDMMDAYPDPAVKLVTVKGDVSLYGDATAEGKKPAIKTLVFNLASGASVLHLEDLVLDGNGTGALTENLPVQRAVTSSMSAMAPTAVSWSAIPLSMPAPVLSSAFPTMRRPRASWLRTVPSTS